MSNSNNNNKKKWLTLGAVGIALLLIPRRSSLKADRNLADNAKKKLIIRRLKKMNKE